MPTKRGKNFRSGDIAEQLGLYLIQSVALGAPVPRTEDVGIDGYKSFVLTAKTGNPYTHESIVRTTKLVVKRINEWEAERAKQENRKPVVIRTHTPHVWRHTFTTRLVEKEVPYETLKLLLGHSSIKTSMDICTHNKLQNYKRLITDVSGMLDIF